MTTTDEEYSMAPQSHRLSYALHGKEVIGHVEQQSTWVWVLYDRPAKTLKARQGNFIPKIKDRRGGYRNRALAFWALKMTHNSSSTETA